MKPGVLIIGADKGGVGKTTVARTVLDYLAAKNIPARAFDAESPRGTLKRFHPRQTDIVDITSTSDQIKILDTLHSSETKVTVIDVRAGIMSSTLVALRDIGFFDAVRDGEFTFNLFHVLGASVTSLDEIDEIMPYTTDSTYFAVKNFINDTSYFDWDPAISKNYFNKMKDAVEVSIPKLTEMAYEQVELAGVPFSTFVANQTPQGEPANYSLVLRGYVRTWMRLVSAEYDRVELLKRLGVDSN